MVYWDAFLHYAALRYFLDLSCVCIADCAASFLVTIEPLIALRSKHVCSAIFFRCMHMSMCGKSVGARNVLVHTTVYVHCYTIGRNC